MEKNNINEEEFEQRQKRILEISDRVLDKLELALTELNQTVVKTKTRQKSLEYDEEYKKLISEELEENEILKRVDSVTDTSALKQIVATLKDVKDIHLGFKNQDEKTEDSQENGVIMISQIESAAEKLLSGEADI